MSKPYSDYMPKKNEKKVLVQGNVPEDLHSKVRDEMIKEDWTWEEFLTGLFLKYLDDKKPRKEK